MCLQQTFDELFLRAANAANDTDRAKATDELCSFMRRHGLQIPDRSQNQSRPRP